MRNNKRDHTYKLERAYILAVAAAVLLLFMGKNVRASVVPAKYQAEIKDEVLQLITVKYKGKSKGVLTYYERKKGGAWKKKYRVTAWLGRNGIGKKKEGDKKTPTGVYAIGQAFGIQKNPGTKLKYTKVNRFHYWCSDSGSKYYNKLIRTDKIKHRNCQGEHLADYKGVYDYAVFIGYNADGKPGKGSAIFLHCSSGRATAGCVAIPKKTLKKIIKRLRPGANPQIIIS